MFKNIRYIDPKLFQEDGQPRYSLGLQPTDWKSFTSFTDNDSTHKKYNEVMLSKGILAYEVETPVYSVFTNNMTYYRSIEFDANKYVILNKINGTNSPITRMTDYYTSIFRGWLLIEEAGEYSFACGGDNCHAFCIDNETFLFESSLDTAYGSKTLTAGLHKVEFYQREENGGDSYLLQWKKPGDTSYSDVSDVFYHREDLGFDDLPEEGFGMPDGEKCFELLYKDEDELIETGEKVKYDKVLGLEFNGYTTKSLGNGTSIDNPLEFMSEQVDGKIYYHKEYGGSSVFYTMKLLAGVTYGFNRSDSGDGQLWFYNEDGSSDGVNYDSLYSFTKTFDKDTTCCIELNYYNRYSDSVNIELSINPLPARAMYSPFLKDTRCAFSNNDGFVLGQNPVTYSFWYYKGENPNGSLISLMKDNATKFCLFIEDGILRVHNGSTSSAISPMSNDLFNKKGINSPVHICFSYDFANSFMSVFVDGLYSYGEVNAIDLNCNKFILGGSAIKDINNLDGTIKWLRVYNRVLSQNEINSLASEFDNCPGDGTHWTKAMGALPDEPEDDTSYVIRRYNDNTNTYIKTKEYNVNKIGIFAVPEDINSIDLRLPNSFSLCPWIGESGSVNLAQITNNSTISSNTISYFTIKDINIVKHKSSSSYMFKFGTSNANSIFSFENCRFSSLGCNIDKGDDYNQSAGRYVFFTGSIGSFIMKNCTIVNTNVYNDAFKMFNCKNVAIEDVNIYVSPSLRSYNAFCFGMIGGSNGSGQDYTYDNFNSYLDGVTIENMKLKNINMIIRANENYEIPGLIVSVGARSVDISNINITQGLSLTANSSKFNAYNGLINIRGMYDYVVKDISINLPGINRVDCFPLVYFFVTELADTVSVSQGKEQNKIIDGINISIGNDSANANTSAQRHNWTTSNIYDHFPLYSVFCVISNDDPMHGINIVKNCSIDADRCCSIAMRGVFGEFENISGVIKVNDSRLDIYNFNSIFNSDIINIWYNGEINIENLNVSNPSGNNLVSYGSSSNGYVSSHVFVKNSNCQIQKLSFNKSGGGDNNAFVHCPNTSINGGFSMNGMSHFIIPVDIHRNNGHGVSLKLSKNGSQTNAFRFPPKPYDGIAYSLTAGRRKMTIHFAEAESNIYSNFTYEKFLDNLWVEVVTSDDIFNSKIDGVWSSDSDRWSYDLLKAFKYELYFNLNKNEKVFVRVYYNVDTRANGGLFLDPKIDLE